MDGERGQRGSRERHTAEAGVIVCRGPLWGGARCPNLKQGPVMASSPLQRPLYVPLEETLEAGEAEAREGGGRTQTPLPAPRCERSPSQTPGREGRREQITHHCRDPSWARLAWRPWWPLKKDEVSGVERVSGNKAPGDKRGTNNQQRGQTLNFSSCVLFPKPFLLLLHLNFCHKIVPELTPRGPLSSQDLSRPSGTHGQSSGRRAKA